MPGTCARVRPGRPASSMDGPWRPEAQRDPSRTRPTRKTPRPHAAVAAVARAPPPPRRPCNLVFVVQGSTQIVNLTFSAPSVTGLTHRAHTAFCSRLDPQHKTHLMFACIAHPGSRLSERGEPREGVEAVDERLRRRAIVTADGVERIDACDTKRMGITHRQAGERGGCPLTGAA